MAELSAIPIVALDVGSLTDALAMVDRLGESCDFYKVGLELFTAEGPAVVQALRGRGVRVFLDLKFHDIPNTVRGAVRSAARLGVSLATVHASGGVAMLEAAAEGGGESLGLLGVSILTSMDGPALGLAWGRSAVDVGAEVLRLAGLCEGAGLHGLVCSGAELGAVRSRFPRLAPLVPGIRFADGTAHDQARVVTPEGAVRGGARYLVLGRAVTGARDPRSAMEAVRQAIGG